MYLFLIYCFSFILLSTMSFKPIPTLRREVRLLRLWFLEEISCCLLSLLRRSKSSLSYLQDALIKITPRSSKIENVEEANETSLLDLPELALECILERLSPTSLCNMAGVCTALRDRCSSDHLWEKHMKQKWGALVGDAAYQEWQCHIASRKRSCLLIRSGKESLFSSLPRIWPPSWIQPKSESNFQPRNSLRADSIMVWYQSLESGKFWFPAQVYNRENGHAGFMLSCYDAKVRYDYSTDTFQARFIPQSRQSTEENIHWERLRAPPINISPQSLHVSDCLADLKPGDHIEIQWRRNQEFPYGWWYGVIGHLELCSGNENHCDCQNSDKVILEFNQYMPGSQWRQMLINRKDHQEIGNDIDGFYGGIRKLSTTKEISVWRRLWPGQILEL